MSGGQHNAEALAAVKGGQIIGAHFCDCGCGIPVLLVRQRRGGPVVRIDVCASEQAAKPGTLILSDDAPAKINPVPGSQIVDPEEVPSAT